MHYCIIHDVAPRWLAPTCTRLLTWRVSKPNYYIIVDKLFPIACGGWGLSGYVRLVYCGWAVFIIHLPCVRMCSRVMCLVASVCVRMYIYVNKSLNTSSVVCYIQRAIQKQQFMPFQIKCGAPWPRNIFF